ncbi:hypothetical protein SmJEL517_g03035 [Synchytrium microbalum]|uniref:Uncharacterized protein n=1 Tax=Synchytrium microbalum TaxID=1806994 RepID=A0A507BYA9_9FUNG|nr:uncharacterized protein SmJEL517_g03035 [Synchytrium microbalum]TPX34300.1 hypothetical protein SmJEL517_g03035 [Synchytrium microbalum]
MSNTRYRTSSGSCTALWMQDPSSVPANPLTAQGLATPYIQKKALCDQTNPLEAVFVEAAIINPKTGNIRLYSPLVVNDDNPTPAVPPVVPVLSPDDVVGLWFGGNGGSTTLASAAGTNSLVQGNCVNGLGASVFGQVAFCNPTAFWAAVSTALTSNMLIVPPLATSPITNVSCYTVRSFVVVDMDQSDNVVTTYLAVPMSNGAIQFAQNNVENVQNLNQTGNVNITVNASDNKLVSNSLDTALGCSPWKAMDLSNMNGPPRAGAALNEIQAALYQQAPIATIPAGDPMVLIDGATNLTKINLYRAGVFQPLVTTIAQASTQQYCLNLWTVGAHAIYSFSGVTSNYPTPDVNAATDLNLFLCQRFEGTWGADGLDCGALVSGVEPPITTTKDANGVAISAAFNLNGSPQPIAGKGNQRMRRSSRRVVVEET